MDRNILLIIAKAMVLFQNVSNYKVWYKLVGKIKFKIGLWAFRYRLSAVGFGKKHGCGY